MEQLAQPPLLVLDDRHPRGDGDEEAVEERRDDRELHRHGELGGDVGLGPPDRRVAALDPHRAGREPPGAEDQDQGPDGEQRAAERDEARSPVKTVRIRLKPGLGVAFIGHLARRRPVRR